MGSAKEKGDRRERGAVELYEAVGYEVERATGGGSHSPDFFDLFDLIAFGGRGMDLVQVKANGARGIESFCAETLDYQITPGLSPLMFVCEDYDGWRVLVPVDRDSHHTIVDEREMDCGMGEGVKDWLQELSRGIRDGDVDA